MFRIVGVSSNSVEVQLQVIEQEEDEISEKIREATVRTMYWNIDSLGPYQSCYHLYYMLSKSPLAAELQL